MPLRAGSKGNRGCSWPRLFYAVRYIFKEAVRAGDLDGAEALQARVRRDAGLDALDYTAEGFCDDVWTDCLRGSRGDSLAMACQPLLYEYLGLEDVCLSAVEKLAGEASEAELAVPGDVLNAVESAVDGLRRRACDGSRWGDECLGWRATETAAVARLREVLEHHGGVRSSEHHRV